MSKKQIILDFGSGNTCHNNKSYIKRMYDELMSVDTKKHEIIIKWQLFKRAGTNIPLTENMFDYAYAYGTALGYQVTASVFDLESLKFLIQYNIPFVKLANNRMLDYLIKYIPLRIPLYISGSEKLFLPECKRQERQHLWCVSNYPAAIADYEKLGMTKGCNISDHTLGFDLFRRYDPSIVEWHYCLKDSTGPDSGDFSKLPEDLIDLI